MPNLRKEILTNQEIYHTYNRTVGNQDIFVRKRELSRALELLDYYRFPQKIKYSEFNRLPLIIREEYRNKYKLSLPLVEIYSYVFMPDHFHLLIKQLEDNGIKDFLSNFQNSFAKYYNKKNERSGSLFQSPFKSKRISNDNIFLHVSRYIHLNPVTSYLVTPKNLTLYPWSSYPCYTGKQSSEIVKTKLLVDILGSSKKYEKFILNQIDYQRRLQNIRKYLLE